MKFRFPLLALLSALIFSCGNEGDDSRAVEILYFAQGATGTPFEITTSANPSECVAAPRSGEPGQVAPVPSRGFGIQSADATHVFTNRRFRAPHYFVIENEFQPTRAVFRNLSETSSLTVVRLLGLAISASTLETIRIPPLECRSFSTFSDEEERQGVAGDASVEQFRVEVCSYDPDSQPASDFHCQDAEAEEVVDVGLAFLATLGDREASFRSSCLRQELSEQTECRTPATFFLHAPRDEVSVAMTRLVSNQDRATLQIDLYRNDVRIGTHRGSGDVFTRKDI